MLPISKATIRRSKRRDRIAQWIITLGGVTVIASVIAILFLIVGVIAPLFRPGRSAQVAQGPVPGRPDVEKVLTVGVELVTGRQRSLTGYLLSADGTWTFVNLGAGKIEAMGSAKVEPPEGSTAKTVIAAERHGGNKYSLLWSDGSASLVEVDTIAEFDKQGNRTVRYKTYARGAFAAPSRGKPRRALLRGTDDEGLTGAMLIEGNQVLVLRKTIERAGLFGAKKAKISEALLKAGTPGKITALAMDEEGQVLYAGTDGGNLIRWDLDDEGQASRRQVVPAFADKRAVTTLGMVLGDMSLAVGDARGELTTWFQVRGPAAAKLRMIHRLQPHQGAVREILPSRRNKALLSLGGKGEIHLDYMTSQRRLLTLQARGNEPIHRMGYSVRGNSVIALDKRGALHVWELGEMYPEVSPKALFGKVFYEGYDEPSYAWQTTGGGDFEPKLSLVPLIFGTFKGTIYAMFFAVPLALFGAAYTSHFTTPAFKQWIKPTVEIMAAVPSVVIGFLVALWLAPIVERWILAVFASLATIPLAFLAFMLFWQLVRQYDWAKRVENGYEFLVLLPVIVVGALWAVALVGPIESHFFGGDFKLWLNRFLEMRYDQRNSIIIAFGLGFAVIPIIFSIAEDALSTVPHNMTAASMALGASRWQTLWRIIIPSASPGIFAGIMIGFGRAVGETMIVLMATGNTPILDASPFNGMRTLSANIAVEIPEAPVGGTLYRVLFLCAVILFLLTFLLNTAAELVRQRLRKRYGRF